MNQLLISTAIRTEKNKNFGPCIRAIFHTFCYYNFNPCDILEKINGGAKSSEIKFQKTLVVMFVSWQDI